MRAPDPWLARCVAVRAALRKTDLGGLMNDTAYHIYRRVPSPMPPSPEPNRLTIKSALRGGLDRAGLAISALCVVHCLAGLALVLVLGAGGSALGLALADPRIHEIGLALAIAVGAMGLGIGFARHRRRDILALGAGGLALMALGLAAPHGYAEALLTIAGVSLLAFAHIRNLRHAH